MMTNALAKNDQTGNDAETPSEPLRSLKTWSNTCCASSTASPVMGMRGENHPCPWLRGPPIANVCRLGTPNGTGLVTFANWSASIGNRYDAPSWNLTPGITENFSRAYSHCAATTLADP